MVERGHLVGQVFLRYPRLHPDLGGNPVQQQVVVDRRRKNLSDHLAIWTGTHVVRLWQTAFRNRVQRLDIAIDHLGNCPRPRHPFFANPGRVGSDALGLHTQAHPLIGVDTKQVAGFEQQIDLLRHRQNLPDLFLLLECVQITI